MRWNVNNQPKVGDTRWVSRFFFFPQRFHNTWIWLEWGKVHQKLVEAYIFDFGISYPHLVWEDVALAI